MRVTSLVAVVAPRASCRQNR